MPRAAASCSSVFAHAVESRRSVAKCGRCWQRTGQTCPFGIRDRVSRFSVVSTCATGDRVGVRSGFVGIRSGSTCRVVDCRSGPTVAAGTRRTRSRRASAAGSPSLRPPRRIVPGMAQRRWQRPCRSALGVPDALRTVLGCVVGHGPGSTPSGDDVLVGIFAVLTASRSGAAGAAAARSLDQMMRPLLPGTTDISMQLLRQASRGLVGRAVHELICAISGGTNLQALRDCHPACCRDGRDVGCGYLHGIAGFCAVIFSI